MYKRQVLFGSWLVYALSAKDWILNNRLVQFISGLSMEVYLCHMVMFRLVEKAHLERIVTDVDWLYAVTCVIVIASALAFAWGYKMIERHAALWLQVH